MKQKATAKQIMCIEKIVINLKRIAISSFFLMIALIVISGAPLILPPWITTVNIDQKLITADKEYNKAVFSLDYIEEKLKNGSERLDGQLKSLKDETHELERIISTVEKYEKELAAHEGSKELGDRAVEDAWMKAQISSMKPKILIWEKIKQKAETRVNDAKALINDLNIQYTETQKAIKTLAPIKDEYYKQLEKKKERESFWIKVSDIEGIIFPCLFFFTIATALAWIYSKSWLFYKKGLIPREWYRFPVISESSANNETNPSTGLPMSYGGTCDVSGTPRGGTPSGGSNCYTDTRCASTREFCTSSSYEDRYWDR